MTSSDLLATSAQIYKMLTFETSSGNEAMVVLEIVRQMLIGDAIDAEKTAGYGHGV